LNIGFSFPFSFILNFGLSYGFSDVAGLDGRDGDRDEDLEGGPDEYRKKV
jgi:hypothetical protein